MEVPQWKLDFYVRGMLRVEAEQARERVRQIAAGTGNLKKQDHAAYMDDLDNRAWGSPGGRRAARARSKEEFLALVGGLGQPGFKVDIKD